MSRPPVMHGNAPAAPRKSRPRKTRSCPLLRKIKPIWTNRPAIVAATGPSLTIETAEKCRGIATIAINDAYRRLPWADLLYACDDRWWFQHKGCLDFAGEKWSSHESEKRNDKARAAETFGLNLVTGKDAPGFSLDPEYIHYGSNSGFQGLNIAILMGADPIILVGFDMQTVDRQRHFFGDHPPGLCNTVNYTNFVKHFDRAAKRLPPEIRVWNATPKSALTCFPKVNLDDALAAVGA